MRNIIRLIVFINLFFSFFLRCNYIVANNVIKRTAEYNEEIADTINLFPYALSNAGGALRIWFKIQAKDKAFDIYSAELQLRDTVFRSTGPFSMSVDEQVTADSLFTWECVLSFPYIACFNKEDMWVINTSHGTFNGSLVPEEVWAKNEAKEMPIWRRYLKYISGVCIILVICIYIRRIYLKRRRKNLEEKLRIEQQFDSKDKINAELREKVGMLYAERWTIFNRLCNEYFNKKDAQSEDVRLSVYKELERQIDDMRSINSLTELENMIDAYDNNLMHRVRVQIPELTKKDVTFLIYLYSGFSPRAICLFTDMKIKNFYNRKTRLKDKILESGAIDREEFSSKM